MKNLKSPQIIDTPGLASMANVVIQAIGWSEFEHGLSSGPLGDSKLHLHNGYSK